MISGSSRSATELEPALRCVLESVAAPLLAHAGHQILFANTPMRRLLGYELSELQSMEFDAWAAEGCRDSLRHYGIRCLTEDGELPSMEAEAITGSGSHRVLELQTKLLEIGATRLAVLTCQDLSDVRHVQTSLLNIGRVLHQIIEGTPVATFVIDAQHRITHWNAACEQLTGADADDVIGRDDGWTVFYAEARPLLADLIVDDTIRQESQRLYGRLGKTSDTIDNAYEAEGFFPNFGDGGRWLHFTAAPLVDTQGHVVGAIETLLDVTQRHQAEEELLRHRNELEAMVFDRTAELLSTHHELEAFLENASVGIISTASQRVTRGNRKFREMFELGEQSAHGMPTRSFFHSEEHYLALRSIAVQALSRGDSLVHEMEMRTLAGNSLWIQLIAYLTNPTDATSGVWWMLQDRTEVRRVQRELEINYERIKQTNIRLEEAQNQLLQSEKMASIGQLAAGVAHEINNPIGFVSSNLSSLRSYVEPVFKLLERLRAMAPDALPDEIRSELKHVDDAVDLEFVLQDLPQLLDESDEGLVRVKKIVQDLKDFSRVDHAEWQDADLNAGLDSTLNVVMNEVKYKAEVQKHYGSLPPVRCIAAQLNQVFMNLIVNAAHAIPERGTIMLSTSEHEGWVCVEVRDTGCGMSEDVRRRIFEPFFTTKPVGRGTGLGLSLSFSIVQKHGGRIEVESTPGLGTKFQVWIPIRPLAVTA